MPQMWKDPEIGTEGRSDGDQDQDRAGRSRGEADDGQGQGRLCRVPGVPEMEGREKQVPDRWQQEVEQWGQWKELEKKQQKAMESALKMAEDYLQEIMTLLREDEPICAIEKDLERIKSNTRSLQKYARMIKGSPKTVVEIFNPKRFAPRCTRAGLVAAAAFDLELGDQLLDPKERDQVMNFIKDLNQDWSSFLHRAPCLASCRT